jgi:branched-chain amino acid aminotransferase
MILGTNIWSKTWTFFQGEWHEGNVPIMGARTHASWLGSAVFDGGRAFEGTIPDVDLHCARVNASAQAMGLKPVVPVEQWMELVHDGLKRFGPNPELYIRPMYWGERASALPVAPDPETTQWCLTMYEAPMRALEGFSTTLSPYRRPTPETALLDAKFGGLYPASARATNEAKARGFESCLMCDPIGNVAEFATANVFMAKDGVVYTPAPNGTFLNGITRQRVIGLLRADGVEVVERALRYSDFETADEIFASGNTVKVRSVNRIDDRSLQPGPFYRRARELYWDFAHGKGKAPALS